MSVEKTGWTVCAEGCCVIIRDTELRPPKPVHEDNPYTVRVAPMYTLKEEHPGMCNVMCTFPAELMIVEQDDYENPDRIFL